MNPICQPIDTLAGDTATIPRIRPEALVDPGRSIDNPPTVRIHEGEGIRGRLAPVEEWLEARGVEPLSYHPGWLEVLAKGLGYTPFLVEATAGGSCRGVLAMAYVRSVLFGKFLVSLPYLNYGGPVADDSDTEGRLIDAAVGLADRLDVRYLELRRERERGHPLLGHVVTEKVHMRLALPPTPGTLWDRFSPKVRNQVRKGQKSGLSVAWGGVELLSEFHDVFSRNMRDLGTPSYGRPLFREILGRFHDRAEFCIVRAGRLPVAAALLTHGWGVTEVPSASSRRSHNHLNANMLMYWHLMERAIDRGQRAFDFGRSSRDSNTFRFKAQWGAEPSSASWQYHLRRGGLKDARPDNPRFARLIRAWQRLPLPAARWLGPAVVRGIP
jgi:FemAB-related protein (PEP-CTERM system-associated)